MMFGSPLGPDICATGLERVSTPLKMLNGQLFLIIN